MWAWVIILKNIVPSNIDLVYLEQKLRSEEDVGESKPHEGGESGHESAPEVEVFSVRSHQRGAGEAAKDGGGDHEGGGEDGGVHHHGWPSGAGGISRSRSGT